MPRGTVDGDRATVRDDPLRACVAKWNSDAYDGFGVVPDDVLDDDVTLLAAQPGALLSEWSDREIRHRWAGHQDRIDRREDAALAHRTDDPSDVAGRQQFLRCLDDENTAVEHVRIEREPPCGQDLLDDLQAPAPASPCDRACRAVPAPRVRRLPLAEEAQSARVTPVHPEVFRLTGISDL